VKLKQISEYLLLLVLPCICQGAGTDPSEVARLREAMTASPPKPVTVTLLNYRKGGSPFWNALHIAPVRDAEGVLEYFIGVQLDVTQQQGQQGGETQAAAAAEPAATAAGEECVGSGAAEVHWRLLACRASPAEGHAGADRGIGAKDEEVFDC